MCVKYLFFCALNIFFKVIIGIFVRVQYILFIYYVCVFLTAQVNKFFTINTTKTKKKKKINFKLLNFHFNCYVNTRTASYQSNPLSTQFSVFVPSVKSIFSTSNFQDFVLEVF